MHFVFILGASILLLGQKTQAQTAVTSTTSTASDGTSLVLANATSLLQTLPTDFPVRTAAALNYWLDGNIRAINSLKIMDLVTDPDMIDVPPANSFDLNTSSLLLDAMMNTTTQQSLWSLWTMANLTTSTVSIGDSNGFVVQYTAYNPGGYSTPWGGGASQFGMTAAYGSISPTQDANSVVCQNTNWFYLVDQNFGRTRGGASFNTKGSYCLTFRPWYPPTFTEQNLGKHTFYGPLFSSTTGVLIYTIATSYYR